MGDLGLAVGLLVLDRDRDREMGDPVEEVGGAIQGIDDPPRLVGIALDDPPFLQQKAPIES